MSQRILYVQYTNPAGYPPLEHSSRILADLGWEVLFLGTGAHGADALEFPPHSNIEVRRWRFRHPGLWQKLHFLVFNTWIVWVTIFWKPKWIYASDILACPAALLLQTIGFRVLYHEHDSPVGAKAETQKAETLKLGSDAGGEAEILGAKAETLKADPPSPEATARQATPKISAFQRFLLWTRRKLARCADLCVLPNEKRVEIFQQETGRKKQTLCVWNCPMREEAEVEPQKSTDEFIVFYHGSIVPDRVPRAVIHALAHLPDNVRLRIAGYVTVGYPNYVRELKELASSLGVCSRFEYIGALSRSALLPQTRKAHVGLALMPINDPGFNFQAMVGASNKPFEYLACGLALLISDLPDWNKTFVNNGYAQSCDPRDANSIAAGLTRLLEHRNESSEMGERGRQRILDAWNYESQFAGVVERLS